MHLILRVTATVNIRENILISASSAVCTPILHNKSFYRVSRGGNGSKYFRAFEAGDKLGE